MTITVSIAGMPFDNVLSLSVKRGLKQAASGFTLEGMLRARTMPAVTFEPVVIAHDGAPVFTGYVGKAKMRGTASGSLITISGKSKTVDVIDCMPQQSGTQFQGYRLDGIARTLAAPFGVNVSTAGAVDLGAAFPDATYQTNETAFDFIERLARQRAVLLTDDENGDLLLATAGSGTAGDAIAIGTNVVAWEAVLDFEKRYSAHAVKSQAGLQISPVVIVNVLGQASDAGVPRYRPFSMISESPLMPSEAQTRALWQAKHNAALSQKATFTLAGWRQSGGALWRQNQLVNVDAPDIGMSGEMLISEIEYRLSEGGEIIRVTVGPPAAFSQAPSAGATGNPWSAVLKKVNGPTTGAAP